MFLLPRPATYLNSSVVALSTPQTVCVPQVNRHREILEGELETVGLRLNKTPPNVVIRMKKTGGVRINKTIQLTKLGEDPEKVVRQVL